MRVGGGTVHPADGIAHALDGVLDEGLLWHGEHEEDSLEEEDALVRDRVLGFPPYILEIPRGRSRVGVRGGVRLGPGLLRLTLGQGLADSPPCRSH